MNYEITEHHLNCLKFSNYLITLTSDWEKQRKYEWDRRSRTWGCYWMMKRRKCNSFTESYLQLFTKRCNRSQFFISSFMTLRMLPLLDCLIIKLNRFMINQFIIHVSSTNSFLIYRVFQYYEVCTAFPLHNRCRHYKTGDYK